MKTVKKVFIIAEIGVNHNGSLELAYRLIDEAVKAGADAVKFQTSRVENVISRFAPKADYQKKLTEKDHGKADKEGGTITLDDWVENVTQGKGS